MTTKYTTTSSKNNKPFFRLRLLIEKKEAAITSAFWWNMQCCAISTPARPSCVCHSIRTPWTRQPLYTYVNPPPMTGIETPQAQNKNKAGNQRLHAVRSQYFRATNGRQKYPRPGSRPSTKAHVSYCCLGLPMCAPRMEIKNTPVPKQGR